ncbi:MAG: polysaccharide deacetylase [Oscillospiraceae bacterium]|jgi:peptidoglycan/xylan/chitin deacetylase (PgdA/CDA1 family)|nr:polysaccharide deacetylase [Oscillospiraceae bacterium]
MKTLSVRFYKRLILIILALLILIPTVLWIYTAGQNAKLRSQLEGKDPTVPSNSGANLPGGAEAIEYQTAYPELYSAVQISNQRVQANDTVYITFDSDISANTLQILDTLDEYGVKATFFVNGTSDAEEQSIMREIVNRGHSIGLRSYSNSYQEIYQSVSAFLDDFNQIYNLVYEVTGARAEIFRFPAGSINAYNSGIYQELIAEMLRRNFVFFDWNVSGEDTMVDGMTAETVQSSVVSGMEGLQRGIVLLRDTAEKTAVADALPGILIDLQNMGYSFQPLTAAVRPVVFSYNSAP